MNNVMSLGFMTPMNRTELWTELPYPYLTKWPTICTV